MQISIRKRVFKIIDFDNPDDRASLIFEIFILLTITASVAVVILESVDGMTLANRRSVEYAKILLIGLFTIEYLLRLWCCPEHGSEHFQTPLLGRIRYLSSPLMLLDLLAILPFYTQLPLTFDFVVLRLFRLLNILDMTRNSRALQMLVSVVVRERRSLLAVFLFILVLLIFSSTIIYSLERDVQPEAFKSIPAAMWWSMATLTTVGYGDVVPLTAVGKVFGVFVMFIGIAMFAVPTGILVSSFYQEIKRKDFIATWELVAQVPFFSQLHAVEIANITDLLRLNTMRASEVIFRKGEKSDAMYFIVSGEVTLEFGGNGKSKSAEGGDFFGEVGILYKTPRTASATAKTFVELLRLDQRDMEVFLESNPQLRDRILDKAEIRKANDLYFDPSVKEK